MDTPVDAGSPRRLSLAVAGAVAIAALGFVAVPQLDGLSLSAACGPGGEVLRVPGQPDACVHADQTPPGVDVTEPVSTRELKARSGAGPAAHEAAEALGVPSVVESTGTGPSVPCDGDGTSGYRVQAMYVVEAGRPNRYAELLPSLRRWASGIDDVFNRSAALTGGVRHLRYVTEPGADGCVASVLSVTVPAGSTSSFGGTIQALQGQGYTDRTRKYLLWTDATVLCGVATMYPNDNPAQSNLNNGSYAQYARVDAGCWGLGNGTTQISVEAHELAHNFGGVQSTAPHATAAGHCWDDSDTMCYKDGSGVTMRQVCPLEREFLLDCNSDDYFSTSPAPGSYLDTRWNSANTRFLIGGGDGTNGGATGTPPPSAPGSWSTTPPSPAWSRRCR